MSIIALFLDGCRDVTVIYGYLHRFKNSRSVLDDIHVFSQTFLHLMAEWRPAGVRIMFGNISTKYF